MKKYSLLSTFVLVLLKSYKNSKFSLAMLMVSLIIGTSGLAAVLIVNNSAKQSISTNTHHIIPYANFKITALSNDKVISKQDYSNLKRAGFTNLVAVAQSRHHLYLNEEKVTERRITITGIDGFSLLLTAVANNTLNGDAHRNSARQNNQNNNALVQLPFTNNSALAHPNLITLINNKANDIKKVDTGTVSKIFSIRANEAEFFALPPLLPLQQASLGNDIVLDIHQYYALVPNAKIESLIWVSDVKAKNLADIKEKLSAALPSHLTLLELGPQNAQADITDSFHINLLAMSLLMFVVCLFIVLNAVNLLLSARIPWLKICRQLGIHAHTIFIVQLVEIVLLTLIATLIGVFLGYKLALVVSPSVQATIENIYQINVGFGELSISSLFLKVFSISLTGCICAVFMPMKALNKRLAYATQTLEGATNTLTKPLLFKYVLTLASIIMMTLAVGIFIFAEFLWLLLIGTALVILTGCCILLLSYPRLLRVLFKLIPHSLPLLQVSAKQTLALSAKTRIACCAFFIAATSNIGMNLMVDSFRSATVSWLDSRLASDYYLYYTGKTNIEEIGKQAGVKITARYERYTDYKNIRLQQFSYPTTSVFKDAMVFYKVDNVLEAWQAFENENGIFVNQQFAFHFDVSLGDAISLPHPSLEIDTTYIIKGVIYDFGSPSKQVLFPIRTFSESRATTNMYAVEADANSIAIFKSLLIESGIDAERALLSTQALLALSMEAFDRTFLITDGLNIITLLVAALSLACAIIVLMNEVRPQNMLIRSLGVSALKTQMLALFQYLLLCIVALIFATPFGILLSWILIYEINLQAFLWTYPLQINVHDIVEIYLVSLLVVLTVIAIPLFQAGKRPLIKDIRWLN
ncbi:FtsX-like permease family protein [Glaciecola petra]|uniref:FtsX-like permease family protein n=1 Tax=Glaciecola petra TaxID=3075602 RepID=A0ABU2ZVK0_9ALTE|nr:FtsX-like permease family protein [Aestuariibacter sp. P117]MDT0596406.1 FtsX-like permease family protein [Aestuariibacter sp. P117]